MQLLFNALSAGSFAALIASGLSLTYGVLRVFNMALGQFALIGGYTAWWLYRVVELPLIISIPVSVFITCCIALLCFELTVYPFYKRNHFLPLVSTIALSMIIDGIILLLFQEQPKTILSAAKHPLTLLGARMSVEQLALIIGTILFLCFIAWVLHATSIGRKIRATVLHPQAAESLGIPSALLHRLLFITSCGITALAGMYIGIDQNLTPTLGFPITIKAYAALIAGGKENVWGTIICAYLIALVEQLAIGVPWFGSSYIPAGYQSAVALLFIIFILILKPAGLVGSKMRAA